MEVVENGEVTTIKARPVCRARTITYLLVAKMPDSQLEWLVSFEQETKNAAVGD